MALPFQLDARRSGNPDPDQGNPDFPEKNFSLFFASMDLLGPQGHPPDGPESPNPDPDREIRFFENPDFSIFRLFKLKDPTTWVSIDSPGCFLLIALLNCPLNKFWGL